MKINQIVRLLNHPEGHMNDLGRVVEITKDGVYVTNMNAPLGGTYVHKFFPFDAVQEW